MSEVYLGLGSNMGDKERNLREAMELLEPTCRLVAVSSFYATEPVGYREQDWFVNCALKTETMLEPHALLKTVRKVESRLGREQNIEGGPRIIDIDILLFDNLVVTSADLTIPHPRMHERLFVLAPLNEIAPEAVHPVLGKTIADLWREAPRSHRVDPMEPDNR